MNFKENSNKTISKEDKFEMQNKEFDFHLQKEENLKNLDIELLKEQLRLVTEKLTTTNLEKEAYKEEHRERIHEYGYKKATKSKMVKFGILGLDIIACIAGNQGLATSWIENMTYSLIQASLIFQASRLQVEKDSTPKPSQKITQLSSMTNLITGLVLILSGVMRYSVSDANGIVYGSTHILISLAVYLVTYLALKATTPNKETVYYNGMIDTIAELEQERQEVYSNIVEREKTFEEYRVNNLAQRHKDIIYLDGEDERLEEEAAEKKRQEEALQKEEEKEEQEYLESKRREKADWELQKQQESVEAEKKTALKKALEERYKLPDIVSKIGKNGVPFLVAFFLSLTACSPENVSLHAEESAVTVFVDPSPKGAAQHIDSLIPNGRQVLQWMGNSLENFTRNGGQYDLFIMGELSGMEHFQARLKPLGVMAFMEQHLSTKQLITFSDSVDVFAQRIRLPPDGYSQSRIVANLADALHFLQQRPQARKVMVIISDLLEHTPSMSFLKKPARELEQSEVQITAYLDKHFGKVKLDGIEIIIDYRAVSEERYDDHRIIVRRIFKRFFEGRGADVKFY